MKTPLPAIALSTWAFAFLGLALSTRAFEYSLAIVGAVLLLPFLTWFASLLRALFEPAFDVLLAATVCAVVGIVALWIWKTEDLPIQQALFALTPLYQLVVVAGGYRYFVKTVGRPPQDVVLDFGKGNGPDRIFFFSVSMLTFVVPMMIIAESQP